MRTNNLLIENQVGQAILGQMSDQSKSIVDLELNQLAPYISVPEDIEIIINNNHLLRKGQMLEFNGFRTHQLLDKARNIQETLANFNTPFSKLVEEHPSIMSFPPEVVWLGNPKALTEFKDNIKWVLQTDNIGFNKDKAEKIADEYIRLISASRQKYEFWANVIQKFEGELLSKLLIDITIELALQAKMKYLCGLVPIIDPRAVHSISIAHKTNIAYAKLIDSRQNDGNNVPKYFYTIPLNASSIPSYEYDGNLEGIVKNVRQALQSNYFDGVHVSVRGLSRISNDAGKVETLSKFIRDINEISKEYLLPIWWSRFGLIGLNTLDLGGCFASYSLNMGIDDVYSSFASKVMVEDTMKKAGKLLNPTEGELLEYKAASKLRNGLPKMEGINVSNLKYYKDRPTQYRKEVVKPFNIAAMNHLNQKWYNDIKNGLEVSPGAEFLQRFKSPVWYRAWGPN